MRGYRQKDSLFADILYQTYKPTDMNWTFDCHDEVKKLFDRNIYDGAWDSFEEAFAGEIVSETAKESFRDKVEL